jgi:hypothetical protein
VPYNAFKAIQYAQIFFGKRTLDKRKLLELYRQYVPLEFRVCRYIDRHRAAFDGVLDG